MGAFLYILLQADFYNTNPVFLILAMGDGIILFLGQLLILHVKLYNFSI
jgi:hypothetical protein